MRGLDRVRAALASEAGEADPVLRDWFTKLSAESFEPFEGLREMFRARTLVAESAEEKMDPHQGRKKGRIFPYEWYAVRLVADRLQETGGMWEISTQHPVTAKLPSGRSLNFDIDIRVDLGAVGADGRRGILIEVKKNLDLVERDVLKFELLRDFGRRRDGSERDWQKVGMIVLQEWPQADPEKGNGNIALLEWAIRKGYLNGWSYLYLTENRSDWDRFKEAVTNNKSLPSPPVTNSAFSDQLRRLDELLDPEQSPGDASEPTFWG